MSKRINNPNEWCSFGFTEEEWWALSSAARWRKRNPEKQRQACRNWSAKQDSEFLRVRARKYQLKSSYGITEETYLAMLEAQDGACAICNTKTPTGKWKVFAVDHCHTTGKVRGLLCNECNRGMGLLKDSPELLQKAIDYLSYNHKAKMKQEKKTRNANRQEN